MRYRVHVGRLPGGGYVATCLDPQVSGKGTTREEALEAVKGEIRTMLEICPCASLYDPAIDLEIAGAPSDAGRPPKMVGGPGGPRPSPAGVRGKAPPL